MTMKTVVNVSCDGENCDHVRASDSNHWLVGLIWKGNVIVTSKRELFPDLNTQKEFNVLDAKDFCGEECAIKWVSKKLTEIKSK